MRSLQFYMTVLVLVMPLRNTILSQEVQVTIQENCEQESCNDGIDNDGDGLIDCLDSDCNDTCFICSTSAPPNEWDLQAFPQAICNTDDFIIIRITDKPVDVRSIVWSNGEQNVDEIIRGASDRQLAYSATLTRIDGCMETKMITLDIVDRSQEPRISTNLISSVTIDGNENMNKLYWCNSWTAPMKLEVRGVTPSDNMYSYLWSNGTTASSTLVIPEFPSETFSITVTNECNDSVVEYFRVDWIQCPCAGDPVLSPQIAATWRSCRNELPDGTLFNDVGGLYGCTRCGEVCTTPQTINDIEYSKDHGGVDIKGDVGDAVHALFGGKVIRSSFICQSGERSTDPTGFMDCRTDEPTGTSCSDELGNQIKIRSTLSDGRVVEVLYGHFDKLHVICNEEVGQGQIIGSMGRTGNFLTMTKTHVHIQARQISTTGSSTLINIEDLLATEFSISPNGDINTVNTILCEN